MTQTEPPLTNATGSGHVRFRHDGRVGRITLDRPGALNALTLAMVRDLQAILEQWREDPAVHAVLVESEGRAFCAGGDVRRVREQVLAGEIEEAHSFFAEEYLLNATIAAYPKPYISLIDGICMGGGLGISVHGSHRIVTEKAVMAMPETAIGLAPDIGASFFLPRLPGALGIYLGITGDRLAGADTVHAGLATHFVPSERLAELAREIALDGPAVIASYAMPLPPFSLASDMAAINRCFSAESIEDIQERLSQTGGAWAERALAAIDSASPSSLTWSLGLLRLGARRELTECLESEMQLVAQIIVEPDFAEGVRAMVVDKDRAPKWTPATLLEVDPDFIGDLLGEDLEDADLRDLE